MEAERTSSASPPGARTTKRRGRLTTTARSLLADTAPRWAPATPPPWSDHHLTAAFGRAAPRLLDIGSGNGSATLAWARDHPDRDVVTVELHRPGLAQILRRLEAGGPANVRVAELDATALLEGGIEAGTFHEIRILFPDPWPKRRHLERRMVDGPFLARIADALPPGGVLHVATDWDDYADQVRSGIAAEPRLVPMADLGAGSWTSVRPDRPVTAYEQRGRAAGRTVTDLLARRVPGHPRRRRR